jgi:hypothetical protein
MTARTPRAPRVVNVRVACQGTWHIVMIHTRTHRLLCQNHPNLLAEWTLLRLANAEPTSMCLKIERAWNNQSIKNLASWPFGYLREGWLPMTEVSCQGQLHRIIVGANGQLGFPDHIGFPGRHSRGVTRTLLQLAGIQPGQRNRCLDVLNHYRAACRETPQDRARYFVQLPDELKNVARRAWHVKQSRP